MTVVQVLPESGTWKVMVDGTDRGMTFGRQAEAEEEGRRIAKELNAEFQLHGMGGQIREKDSHGNDPSEILG